MPGAAAEPPASDALTWRVREGILVRWSGTRPDVDCQRENPRRDGARAQAASGLREVALDPVRGARGVLVPLRVVGGPLRSARSLDVGRYQVRQHRERDRAAQRDVSDDTGDASFDGLHGTSRRAATSRSIATASGGSAPAAGARASARGATAGRAPRPTATAGARAARPARAAGRRGRGRRLTSADTASAAIALRVGPNARPARHSSPGSRRRRGSTAPTSGQHRRRVNASSRDAWSRTARALSPSAASRSRAGPLWSDAPSRGRARRLVLPEAAEAANDLRRALGPSADRGACRPVPRP